MKQFGVQPSANNTRFAVRQYKNSFRQDFLPSPQSLQRLERTGRGWKSGKPSAIPKNAPLIPDRLNLLAEFWLQAVKHFAKRRAANRVTPASGFDSTARPVLTSHVVQQPSSSSRRSASPRTIAAKSQYGWRLRPAPREGWYVSEVSSLAL